MNGSHSKGSPMQARQQRNQKDGQFKLASKRLLASSLVLCISSIAANAIAAPRLAQAQTAPPASPSAPTQPAPTTPEPSPPAPASTPPASTPPASTPPASTTEPSTPTAEAPATEETLTNLVTLMLGVLILMVGTGIVMLWFYRRSVVNEVATIVRTQLNEMTELENKVHNATRSLNRVLAEADDLSGDLQGRSSNFQREVAAQRDVLYKLVEELNAFKVQTARNWEQQLEDINGKLEATVADFNEVANGLRNQTKQRLDGLQSEAEAERQQLLQRFTTSEAEFARHVGVIKEETQRRKVAFFDEIERKESVLSDQMGSLQAQTVAEQERVLSSLSKLSNDFGPKLSEVENTARAKIERQREASVENLKTSEATAIGELEEIQASALGH
ncbi:MAG: hypothetical protein ABG776_02070, partial [Cyanobacteria bacterium J06555_13]